MPKPISRPRNPCFSSGPCAKRPGWSTDLLRGAAVGLSHRGKRGKAKLAEVIDRSRKILGLPENYLLGIVPASDTGAVEMALWSLLGARGVDVLAWESFGAGWASDCKNQLKLKDLNVHKADYGKLPDLSKAHWNNDVVFTWNGTTSGVRVPNGDWIAADRQGLSICDATSAAFAMNLPWDKLDVVTWSWQKVLGGEAAHGMVALSPRAVERLLSYTPAWPLPKIFQMTKGGKLMEGIFRGETINTPSMLCVEDALDGLKWGEANGGLAGLIKRSEANLKAVEQWVAKSPWVAFLAEDAATRSSTSICLKIVDPWFTALAPEAQGETAKKIAAALEKENVAFDIGAYRDAPPGLRLWGGATVETADLNAIFPWIEWSWNEVKNSAVKAA
ncbi:MAG: phosphoserine transaminase [Pseudomonadota bacterium]|nr:phosphoserine transaminase [Pseudomonadota bacterium]